MKKTLVVTLLAGCLILSACGNNKNTLKDDTSSEATVTVEANASDPEERDESSTDYAGMSDEELIEYIDSFEYSSEKDVNGITFSETAYKDSVINDNPVQSELQTSMGDLDNARKEYLVNLYDGDEIAAEEDFEDPSWDKSATLTASDISDILANGTTITESISRFDITDYNLLRPFEVDGADVTYDMYNSTHERVFMLTVCRDDEGYITDIMFEEE